MAINTYPKNSTEKLSANFKVAEFACKGTDCCKTVKIDSDLVVYLQKIRDYFGAPVTINSGYRCAELNKKVGGVATSQHTKGQAADCGCDDPLALARLLLDLGLEFDQAIVYPTFLHISHKADGENRNQLLYNKSYTGPRL